jgi:glyoxylase-like metal-dependent hydrolase (beta-lactamase superfamily II)
MRVHHLNCGCMCPVGGRLWDGVSRGPTANLICHCLLVESEAGLILIDTGFGMRDVAHPYSRLSALFIHVNRIKFDPRHTALGQLRRLGFSSRDVRLQTRRYRPEQWDEVREWRHYEADGESWFGFEAVRDLDGLPPEILLVPLPGHTWGHAGVERGFSSISWRWK